MAESGGKPVREKVVPEGGVVVGDDGSAAADRALRFAAEEAARRGTTLHVLRAWTITSAPKPRDWTPGYVPSLAEFDAAAREETEARVARLLADGPAPDVPVQVHTVHGPAAQALLDASAGADVLVVGARGRGGFAELMLGSVAEQCVRHARCPVVVVRSRR